MSTTKKPPMTENEKRYFLFGAFYALAITMKQDGCFEDLTTQELVRLLICEVTGK